MRELWKKEPKETEKFLYRWKDKCGRLIIRYATEKMDKEYRKKLLAMGLIKGTEFTVSRVAPMGDPVEIEIRGYNLSLRKDEASIVAVEGV